MKPQKTSKKIMKQIILELMSAEEDESRESFYNFINRVNSDPVYKANFKCLNGLGCVGYTHRGGEIIDCQLNAKGRTFIYEQKEKLKSSILNWSFNIGLAAISAVLGAFLARISELIF